MTWQDISGVVEMDSMQLNEISLSGEKHSPRNADKINIADGKKQSNVPPKRKKLSDL